MGDGGAAANEKCEVKNEKCRFDALRLPFRQVQGPEPVEGLKALRLSKGQM